jgi:hypothetical protein
MKYTRNNKLFGKALGTARKLERRPQKPSARRKWA